MTWNATETGPALQILSANQFSSPWVTLKLPYCTQPTAMLGLQLQGPSLAVQGQVRLDSMPRACLMYSNAWEGRPPLHPWLSQAPAQSTNCCSAKVMLRPLPRMFQCDQREPTVENVQHDPQLPWFFTGLTIPQLFHSYSVGIANFSLILRLLVAEHCWGAINRPALNSSKVMSEKSFKPCFQLCLPMLWFLTSRRVSTKIMNRQSDFCVYGLRNCEQISLANSISKVPSPSRNLRYLTFKKELPWQTANAMQTSRILYEIIISEIYYPIVLYTLIISNQKLCSVSARIYLLINHRPTAIKRNAIECFNAIRRSRNRKTSKLVTNTYLGRWRSLSYHKYSITICGSQLIPCL